MRSIVFYLFLIISEIVFSQDTLISVSPGMTASEFVAALNYNYQLTNIQSPTAITSGMSTSQLVSALNSNQNTTLFVVGQKASPFVSSINNYFSNNDVSLAKPIDDTVYWVDDYAKILFTEPDTSFSYEIYESMNDENYYLAQTISSDSFDYYTWQNALLKYKIRSVKGNKHSAYTSYQEIESPLVFKVDQSPLDTVVFLDIRLLKNSNFWIDWGDGDTTDFTSGSSFLTAHDVYHAYADTGQYYIQLHGSDSLYWLDFSVYDIIKTQYFAYGDLSKWIFPRNLGCMHLYNHNFSGDITNWDQPTSSAVPSKLGIMHLQKNNFTGDVTSWEITPTQVEVRLTANYNLTGDITDWDYPTDNGKPYWYLSVGYTKIRGDLSTVSWPDNTAYLEFEHSQVGGDLTEWVITYKSSRMQLSAVGDSTWFYGDISGWVLPDSTSSMGYVIRVPDSDLTGDLSSWIIPPGKENIEISLNKNNLTGIPRGNYRWVSILNYNENNCSSSEIDSFLSYIDNYFTGEVVPLTNCVYTLDGTGMGTPSAAGLISRISILNKYTLAGKSATILVNQ